MQTKLAMLKEAFNNGNLKKAISIAARFPNLGQERNAILDAQTAFVNPRWALGMGKDLDKLKSLGKQALISKYHI